MSTAPSNPPAAVATAAVVEPRPAKELRIVSHCTLFYWWPVWVFGFIMALITFVTGDRMVLVDKGSEFYADASIKADGKEIDHRGAWVLKEKTSSHLEKIRISRNKNLGVTFAIVLLLVIAITNVPLRGMWSVIVIILIVTLSISFALLGWWDAILTAFSILDIRINFEGYMLISTVLLVLWLVVFYFFDNQIYMVFTPNQFRVKQEIGDAETTYDTVGIRVQKQRNDLFRHFILGWGSGDLIVNTSGAQAHQFEMSNVLRIGDKVDEIERLLSSRSAPGD